MEVVVRWRKVHQCQANVKVRIWMTRYVRADMHDLSLQNAYHANTGSNNRVVQVIAQPRNHQFIPWAIRMQSHADVAGGAMLILILILILILLTRKGTAAERGSYEGQFCPVRM